VVPDDRADVSLPHPTRPGCLTVLYEGPLPAGKSAEAIGLTPAAVTSLLDRLEKRGLVRRKRSAEDRRKVLVEITPRALELADRYYGPTFRAREKHLASLMERELAVVERFVRESLELQQRQLAALDPERARRA